MSTTLARINATGAACLLLYSTLALAGCNGFNPIGGVQDALRATAPEEMVEMATDRYDADRRRRGFAKLAEASFGGEAPYVALYRAGATDDDPTVRAICIMALGLHGGPEDGPVLVRHLGHHNKLLRWEAARALGRIHYPDSVLPLTRVLNDDEDADVRQAAARALGQYRRTIVFDALTRALDDPDHGVAAAAQSSLKTLTGRDKGPDRREWVAWREEVGANRIFEEAATYQWHPYRPPTRWWEHWEYLVPPFTGPDSPEPRMPRGWDQEEGEAG